MTHVALRYFNGAPKLRPSQIVKISKNFGEQETKLGTLSKIHMTEHCKEPSPYSVLNCCS